MRVVIAGGHGKIALLLERLLAERGDQAVGLIRNPAQVADVEGAGAEAVVCDLEAASADDVTMLLSGADAVVFAAGAGPGSGAPRKDSVDRAASVLMADAAERAGVRRFVQVSSMGAGQPPRPCGAFPDHSALRQRAQAGEQGNRQAGHPADDGAQGQQA
jgi:nucleoside-diphosphate-sugar epimerase